MLSHYILLVSIILVSMLPCIVRVAVSYTAIQLS